jgi:hypothetical protein
VHHGRAHWFFSNARWSVDQVGLVVAKLVVDSLRAMLAMLDPGVGDDVGDLLLHGGAVAAGTAAGQGVGQFGQPGFGFGQGLVQPS